MEISDKERREVARKLRENNDWRNSIRALWNALGIRPDLVETTSTYDYLEHNGKKIFNHLADLIDRPTCNMDVMTTDERADYECSEHIMRCLNCGAEFGYVLYSEDGDVSMDDKPNYCPHCGTRVVSDDD